VIREIEKDHLVLRNPLLNLFSHIVFRSAWVNVRYDEGFEPLRVSVTVKIELSSLSDELDCRVSFDSLSICDFAIFHGVHLGKHNSLIF
jgi:hypothetical protein